jgi:paraquat-inducible protein A
MSENPKVTPKPSSTALTLSLSFTALILYVPANIYPFMTIEMYGRRNTATVWGGIVSLADRGSWAIAVIIFLASILIPLLKLLILFYLSFSAHNGQNTKLKLQLYKFVEAIGRWSMLDIFLLAVLVAIFKLGRMAHAEPGFGSLMFLAVVICTMFASAVFDPQILKEDSNEKN